MGTQLHDLTAAGQSIWLDNIRRSMFASGELKKLIDSGLRGMTSNPTIFEKAIGAGADYDAQLATLVDSKDDTQTIFEALAIDDIRHALDLFRPLYDETHGGDGFVSLEVSPRLARDREGTVAAAKRLWSEVDRPNLMIKIPSTPECIPAIADVIEAGINVNVTLIFSIDAYEAAANAYIEGLRRRADRNEPIDKIASVASVFVSRIDTAVDKLLEARLPEQPALKAQLGKTGIAGLKLIYERFEKLFASEPFASLRSRGAHPQRPLWASTGTKNPAYSDVMYVENLVGRDTVNTVPPATLDAVVDHLVVRPNSVSEDLPGAHATLDAIAATKISLFDVTKKLQDDGVDSFAESYDAMLKAIDAKLAQLRSGDQRVRVEPGASGLDVDAVVKKLADEQFLQRLWAADASPWSTDPAHVAIITKALGWLTFPDRVHAGVDDLRTFAAEAAKAFTHVVVLGMGGSSLAPDVLRVTFGHTEGYPTLHVLDSSDPDQITTLEKSLDLATSLFIVASKSGTTTEPEAFFRYFYKRVQETVGQDQAGSHFIAITDPETALAKEADENGFRRTFLNDPNIGGRYSALSYFGMVPGALAGYDVAAILDRGLGALHSNSRTTDVTQAPGVRFGAAIGGLAKKGRDKLTIVCHPEVAAFGTWAEQLIAESTGKSGTGIVPIEGETLGEPHVYGDDRVFVYVGEGLPAKEHVQGAMDGSTIDTRLQALAGAGHPVIRLAMTDVLDIGEQFALWEIAVAAAGSIIGIDAFDQPNVQESKDNTKRLLGEYAKSGSLPESKPVLETATANVIPISGSKNDAFGKDLSSALAAVFAQVKPGDYVAVTAYIERDHEHEIELHDVRMKIRDALKVATTVGFGPRFLHSTGQLHKGGPATGVFLQLTADPSGDLPIPGMASFATLLKAQALGDFESLDKRDRRGTRLHFTVPIQEAIAALSSAVDDALAVRH